jgi:hypothetical protein
VLLHDVVVVEQPIPRRPNVGVLRGRLGESLVRIVEDLTRAGESGEQRGSALAAPVDQLLGTRLGAGALGQMLGAEELSADRTGERFLPVVWTRGEELRREAGEGEGRDGDESRGRRAGGREVRWRGRLALKRKPRVAGRLD